MATEKITSKQPELEAAMSHVSKVDGNPDFRQDDLDGIVERGLKSRHIQLIALG